MTVSRQGAKWWRLDPQRVLAIALFVALFAMSAREVVDPDFWWHLATGRYIVETRSIPRHDVFSYTATDHKWITHEWLTQVGMIGLYNLGGLTALLLATCAVITLTFYVVYLQCDARPHLAVFGVLLGALASAVTWGARPQMLNALLAAWFTYLLWRYRAGDRRALWVLPLSTVLWVNLHSGYFLGLFLVAVFIGGELLSHLLDHRAEQTLSLVQIRGLSLSLVACVVASLINPNTYKMLWYPFETLGSGAMQRYIQEWAPPDFRRVEYWPSIALLFGGAAAMVFSRRRHDLTEVMLFFGLGFASLLSARNIPLFAVVATPILTRYLTQIKVGRLRWDLTDLPRSRPPSRGMVVLNWALVLAFVLAGAARVVDMAIKNRDVEFRRYPLRALAYIDESGLADKRMYNTYNWGGYLLWRGYEVYIDGRADVYLDEFMDEYVLAYQLRGDWRRPLDRFDVEYILIESGASFEALLEASDEWTRVYRDDQAVIFVRAA
jgi:hypothetical protein